MSGTPLWLTMLGMGAITYGIRLSFILLWGKITLPPVLQRSLRFVPPAVLSAIIFPEILRHGGAWNVSPLNPRNSDSLPTKRSGSPIAHLASRPTTKSQFEVCG